MAVCQKSAIKLQLRASFRGKNKQSTKPHDICDIDEIKRRPSCRKLLPKMACGIKVSYSDKGKTEFFIFIIFFGTLNPNLDRISFPSRYG